MKQMGIKYSGCHEIFHVRLYSEFADIQNETRPGSTSSVPRDHFLEELTLCAVIIFVLNFLAEKLATTQGIGFRSRSKLLAVRALTSVYIVTN